MTYEKVAWVGLTVVIQECNEDGNMVQIRDLPMQRVHYPADTSLSLGYAVDQALRAVEGELARPSVSPERPTPPQTFPERER